MSEVMTEKTINKKPNKIEEPKGDTEVNAIKDKLDTILNGGDINIIQSETPEKLTQAVYEYFNIQLTNIKNTKDVSEFHKLLDLKKQISQLQPSIGLEARTAARFRDLGKEFGIIEGKITTSDPELSDEDKARLFAQDVAAYLNGNEVVNLLLFLKQKKYKQVEKLLQRYAKITDVYPLPMIHGFIKVNSETISDVLENQAAQKITELDNHGGDQETSEQFDIETLAKQLSDKFSPQRLNAIIKQLYKANLEDKPEDLHPSVTSDLTNKGFKYIFFLIKHSEELAAELNIIVKKENPFSQASDKQKDHQAKFRQLIEDGVLKDDSRNLNEEESMITDWT